MTERVQIGEHSIAYRIAGEGPALVLLHGFLCDSRVWRRQLEALSDQFTVLAWDAPGAGGSSDPPQPFTITQWGQVLARWLEAIGAERAHVLGLSWGGMLAQELYRLDPDRVQTLILADTYAGWKGSLPADAVAQRLARCIEESSLPPEEFVRRWVPQQFFTESAPEELAAEMRTVVAAFHPPGFRLMATALAETDTTELLPKIDVPTLLLWGDSDVRSPLSVARQFAEAVPHAELVVVPGAGHVSNMERPDEFNAHVRRFCTAHPMR